MKDRKIIRAADYLPEPAGVSGNGESFALPASHRLLLNLFGDLPDYGDARFEAIWDELLDVSEADTVAYCRQRGVDIMGDNGRPVHGFRDVSVVLKAIETGLLALADPGGGAMNETDQLCAEIEAVIARGHAAIYDNHGYINKRLAVIRTSDPKKAAALELKILAQVPKDKLIIKKMRALKQIVKQ